MSKRSASTLRWNAPKRRKTAARQKITLAQLPASVKPEVKFSDRTSTVSANWSFIQAVPDATFAAVPQGDDGDQMTGSDCFLRSVDYSLDLPTTGWGTCRVSVLVPRDPSISPVQLAPTLKYGHREFIVLYDELFSINEKNHCRIKRKLDLKQKWNLDGTVITDNNVYVLANTDSVVVHTSAMRTYFTDP